MTRWALAWRLAAAFVLGAALGPYHYPDAITGGDTALALGLVVAPLFLALWLDRGVKRKALASLLLVCSLCLTALLIVLFFALGDHSARLWFLIAAWLIPGTAAFAFGCVAPRINATVKVGIWCALLAAVAVFAHVFILQQIEPAVTGPCGRLHMNSARCPAVHPLSGLFDLFVFFLLALGVVMSVFEGIMAVACRIWLTRLSSGQTLLGQPRRDPRA